MSVIIFKYNLSPPGTISPLYPSCLHLTGRRSACHSALSLSFRLISMFMNIIASGPQVSIHPAHPSCIVLLLSEQ